MSRRASCTFTLLALSAGGCGQVLGLDSYALPGTDGGGPGSGAGWAPLPLLPAVPDSSHTARCQTCVRAHCATEYDRCQKSERCRDLLRCMGPSGSNPGCKDPGCSQRCADGLPPSPYFQAYFACAFTSEIEHPTPNASQCASECGAGNNWECAGGFDWDPPSIVIDADVQISDYITAVTTVGGPAPTLPFMEVATCHDGYPDATLTGDSGCEAWVPLKAYGGSAKRLSFANETSIAVRHIGETVHPGTCCAQQRIYPRPVRRSGSLQVGVVQSSGLTVLASSMTYDPALGVVYVTQVDCLGTLASTEITLPAAASARRGYVTGLSAIDPTLKSGNTAMFVDVPPAQAVVVASSLDGARRASRRTVLVAGQWFTSVLLYPMSREDALQ
jgi:hypothetical protein